MSITDKDLKDLDKLFKESEGKDSDFVDDLAPGEYDAIITKAELYQSNKSKNMMIKVTVSVEQGLTSVYLTSIKDSVHFIDRFKALAKKLEVSTTDLETALEGVVGKEVKLAVVPSKDDPTNCFKNIKVPVSA